MHKHLKHTYTAHHTVATTTAPALLPNKVSGVYYLENILLAHVGEREYALRAEQVLTVLPQEVRHKLIEAVHVQAALYG